LFYPKPLISGIQELVDITEKTQLARQAIESAKSFGYEVKQDQLPISGLFRAQTHTIAIRYILLDQQVVL
jgi:hypothetical protein